MRLVNVKNGNTIYWDEVEELVVGRGEQSGCLDKRVSRRHARFYRKTNGKIAMDAIHTNPCFFMKDGKPPQRIIDKGSSIELENGDYVGFIPNDIWFKIVLRPITERSENKNDETCTDSDQMLLDAVESFNDTLLDVNECPERPPSPEFLNDWSPGSPIREMDLEPISEVVTEELPRLEEQPLAAQSVANDGESVGESSSPKVRVLPSWMKDAQSEPPAKKLVTIEALDADSSQPNSPPISDNIITCDSNNETVINNNVETELPLEVETLAATSTVSAVPIIKQEKPGCDTTSSISQKAQSQPVADQCATGECNPALVKVERQANVAADEANSNAAPSETAPSRNASLVTDSISAQPPQPRLLCWYQQHCFRTNPEHKAKFIHPSDADWVPEERRPLCEYDPNCYRISRAHRVMMRHTCQPQPRSNVGHFLSNVVLGLADVLNGAGYSTPPSSGERSDSELDYDDDDDEEVDPYHTDDDGSDYSPPPSPNEE